MGQAPVCNWSNFFIGRRGEMIRGQGWVEDSADNDERGIFEKLSNGDKDVFAFDFNSYVILLGYPRYAEHAE